MDIAQGNIGAEAKYAFKFEDGKLKVTQDYVGTQAEEHLQFAYDAKAVVLALAEKAKAAIPGQIDDMLIDALLAVVLK